MEIEKGHKIEGKKYVVNKANGRKMQRRATNT